MNRKKDSVAIASTLVVGIIQIVIGAGMVCGFGIALLAINVSAEAFDMDVFAANLAVSLFFLGGASTLYAGIRNCKIANWYRKLTTVLAPSTPMPMSVLAGRLYRDTDKILRDIARMLGKRLWTSVSVLDDCIVMERRSTQTVFMISPDEGCSFVESRKRYPIPLMLTEVFAACASLLVYPFINRFITLLAALAAGFLVHVISAVFMPASFAVVHKMAKTVRAPKPKKVEKPEKQEPVNTGNPEVDELLRTGHEYLVTLHKLDDGISDEHISARLVELSDIVGQILGLVRKNPEKHRQISRMVDYYLPTTIKLLTSYDELSREPVKGANIKDSMAKIEGMMDMVAETFRRELDGLYQDKALDIGVDIEVMESMMKEQGMR